MNIDAELDVWRQQWQSGTSIHLDLRTKVERQSRFMKIAFMVDILVTIVMGGGTTTWAVRSPQPDIVMLAAATWLFLAAAWTFTLTVSRGNWSPSALDTATFVDLSVRRCRGRIAAVRFAAGLFLCEIVFCLGWVYKHTPEQRKPLLTWLFFSSLPIDIVWLSTLAFFGFLVWYRRRKQAELAYLLDLRVNLRGQMTEATRDMSARQHVESWSPRSWLLPRSAAGRLRRGKRNRET
jgi:hypothetical protein